MKHRPTATAAPTITTGPATPITQAAAVQARPIPAAFNNASGNGHTDLTTGRPKPATRDRVDAGAITTIYGRRDNATFGSARTRKITKSTPGIPGGTESQDRLGKAPTPPDSDKDSRPELVVSVPGGENGGSDAARIVPTGSNGRVKTTGARATAPMVPGGHFGFAFTR
jgi:hypothetical protein